MTPDPAVVAYVLADSDRADRELALRLQAWRDGWQACERHHGDQYQAGHTDAVLACKWFLHAVYREVQLDLRRWDGLRHNYGKPRPDDIQPPPWQGAA